jgi:hypothetical protein
VKRDGHADVADDKLFERKGLDSAMVDDDLMMVGFGGGVTGAVWHAFPNADIRFLTGVDGVGAALSVAICKVMRMRLTT